MTTTTIISVLAALVLAPAPAAALAHEGTTERGEGGGRVSVSAQASAKAGASASSSVRVETEGEGELEIEEASSSDNVGTSSESRGKSTEARSSAGVNASTNAPRGEGKSGEHNDVGEQHRSEVANIVHKLLLDAERDGGIGAEVRAVAMAQASSSGRAAKAAATLDGESGFKKFFLGPSYTNLGELRSSVVTTENSIERLTRARDRATDAAVKADLDAQIAALTDIASSTRAYVEEHASGFSLFGWLMRLVGV